ncbi:MAG: orotate phosphoribosyltransferase [Nanoarchaeota archaeon]|nr:orotate phosphoribosyltransferase [Nanoarchaeota archaeon]
MRDYKGTEYKANFSEFTAAERSFKGVREEKDYWKLKSGRMSPYFVNMGGFSTGAALDELSMAFAARIDESLRTGQLPEFNVVFGLPYKGIVPSGGTVVALGREFGREASFSSYRKETKDHGDKGPWLGHKPQPGDKLLLLDDVLTTGAAKDEGMGILSQYAPESEVVGLIITVDRKETVHGSDQTAVQQFEEKYNIPVISIVDIIELVDALHGREINGEVVVDDIIRANIGKYLGEFGFGNPWRK